MKPNPLKQKLRSDEPVFGCFCRYADADVAEFLALQPFDFMVIDGEHGVSEPVHWQAMVRSAELHETPTIIRVPRNERATILRAMDTGAQGVMVPMVNSAEEAESAVRYVKYPPRGIRGLAGARAADYAQRMPFDEYITYANEHSLVCVQIETRQAVDAVAQIAEVEGVDVIFIGPTDLSTAMGAPSRLDDPAVRDALDKIAAAVTASDKHLGIMVANAEAALRWVDRGARFVAVTSEAMMSSGCKAFLNAARRTS